MINEYTLGEKDGIVTRATVVPKDDRSDTASIILHVIAKDAETDYDYQGAGPFPKKNKTMGFIHAPSPEEQSRLIVSVLQKLPLEKVTALIVASERNNRLSNRGQAKAFLKEAIAALKVHAKTYVTASLVRSATAAA